MPGCLSQGGDQSPVGTQVASSSAGLKETSTLPHNPGAQFLYPAHCFEQGFGSVHPPAGSGEGKAFLGVELDLIGGGVGDRGADLLKEFQGFGVLAGGKIQFNLRWSCFLLRTIYASALGKSLRSR